jgi:hypothetical protein
LDPKGVMHNHSTNLFYGHEGYSLLTTIRNPYSLMVSKYKFWYPDFNFTLENFSLFLESWFYHREDELSYLGCYNYLKRTPDHFIRTESMYDDYIKVPFITKSEYYKSGQLFKDCNQKTNVSEYSDLDWRTFYNQTSADNVFYNFAHIFELGGYDKNSWKQ